MSTSETPAPARPVWFGRLFWRDPNTQFLILAAAAGLLGGLGAIVFRFLTHQLTQLLYGARDIVRGVGMAEPWMRVVVPAIGGLVGGLVAHFFYKDKGPSGISHMIEVARSAAVPCACGRRSRAAPRRSRSSPPEDRRAARVRSSRSAPPRRRRWPGGGRCRRNACAS